MKVKIVLVPTGRWTGEESPPRNVLGGGKEALSGISPAHALPTLPNLYRVFSFSFLFSFCFVILQIHSRDSGATHLSPTLLELEKTQNNLNTHVSMPLVLY
jgi:hypothetical protein